MALPNVPIFLPGRKVYGLLQVDDTKPRDFSEEDTKFLRTHATILGPEIDRVFKVGGLLSSEERFRLTVEAARTTRSTSPTRTTGLLPGCLGSRGMRLE